MTPGDQGTTLGISLGAGFTRDDATDGLEPGEAGGSVGVAIARIVEHEHVPERTEFIGHGTAAA